MLEVIEEATVTIPSIDKVLELAARSCGAGAGVVMRYCPTRLAWSAVAASRDGTLKVARYGANEQEAFDRFWAALHEEEAAV